MAAEREVALITGASSGIGAELARSLARRGYDCIVTARRTDRLESLKGEIEKAHGVGVTVLGHDLAAPDSGPALAQQVDALGRPLGLLVNNAGFGIYGPVIDHDYDKVKQMMELNMASLTALTWHYGRQMAGRGRGRILQISSVGAYQPSPWYAIYSATKAYVLSFSEAMNHELKAKGVSITTMCPGLTQTEFHERADHVKPKSMDRLFMTAERVAEIGLKATFKGRAVVTPGLPNKLSAFMVRLLPRSWVVAVAGNMMKGRRG